MSKMSTEAVSRTRRALLAFYDGHRRELPWRDRPEPYRVWISEVMLQQTRVDTVLPYYRSWLERFPDVGALAGAPLEDVLRVWEGLGYYSRARNLHRAALVVRDRLGGELPSSATALRALPGIGAYTAGAIASIAFGERVPAVDGNVRRVLARLLDEPEPEAAWLRDAASALVDPARPGDLNQALMELGATVCTPRAPSCGSCPVAGECRARARGTVADRPARKRRKPIPDREFGVAALLRARAGRLELLLGRRPPEGLLGGLWELPTCAVDGSGGPRAAAARAARAAGVRPPRGGVALPAVPHVYSHFRGIYHAFLWTASARGDAPAGEREWVDVEALRERPLSTAQRRIARSAVDAAERVL